MIKIHAKLLSLAALVTLFACVSEYRDEQGTTDRVVTTYNQTPDALFRDFQTDIEIRWNKPPRLVAYDDVEADENRCTTTELACIEFPFPLVIPRKLNTQGYQKTTEGRLRFYATSGPSVSAFVCDVDYFRVVTQLVGSKKSYQFDFSRTGGLERVAVFQQDNSGQPSVDEVFNLVAGKIFDHAAVCS